MDRLCERTDFININFFTKINVLKNFSELPTFFSYYKIVLVCKYKLFLDITSLKIYYALDKISVN